jgi:hypothetical protein
MSAVAAPAAPDFPADNRIIRRNFERWFKQRDESSVNAAAAIADRHQLSILEKGIAPAGLTPAEVRQPFQLSHLLANSRGVYEGFIREVD